MAVFRPGDRPGVASDVLHLKLSNRERYKWRRTVASHVASLHRWVLCELGDTTPVASTVNPAAPRPLTCAGTHDATPPV